jgi:hypothetical protein
MMGPYRNRHGEGKCEANRFLMNRSSEKADSESVPRVEFDKAFVIQNLLPRPSKTRASHYFFPNISLDSRLSPGRRLSLVMFVDNHL